MIRKCSVVLLHKPTKQANKYSQQSSLVNTDANRNTNHPFPVVQMLIILFPHKNCSQSSAISHANNKNVKVKCYLLQYTLSVCMEWKKRLALGSNGYSIIHFPRSHKIIAAKSWTLLSTTSMPLVWVLSCSNSVHAIGAPMSVCVCVCVLGVWESTSGSDRDGMKRCFSTHWDSLLTREASS